MIRTTTTLALTLSTLLLARSALAGPKKSPPVTPSPPLATTLTLTEQLCEQRGHYTLTVARARDSGLSLLRAIAIVRRVQASHAFAPEAQAGEAIIHLVYAFPDMAPTRLQQTMERACLKSMAAEGLGAPPTEAKDARLRY